MVPVAVGLGVMAANLIGNQLNSAAQQEAKEQGRAYLRGAQSQANTAYSNIIDGINDYYDRRRGSLGTSSDADAYRQLIAGYNVDDYVYTPGKFEGSEFDTAGDRSQYINPYYQQIIGDTAEQVQHTAAGAGVGRGSGAAYQIAKEVAEKNRELYNDAYGRYQDARDFAYGKYNDYIQNMQNALAQRRAAMDSKISMTGNLANDYVSTMDAQMSDMLKAKQDRIGAQTSYATAMAGLY